MTLFNELKDKGVLVLLLVAVFLTFSITSCKKSADSPESTDEMELSSDKEENDESDEDDAFAEYEDDGDFGDEDYDNENDKASDEKGEEKQEDVYSQSSTDELFADEGKSDDQYKSYNDTPAPSGDVTAYTVRRGDSLLKIAFKVFRSYERWRELLQYNPDISNPNIIEVGQQIRYPSEYQQRVVADSPDEYIIQRGETLGSISQKLYGTPSHWRQIANLNPEKIRNPNLIYAGTSIKVTLSGVQRSVATDNYEQNHYSEEPEKGADSDEKDEDFEEDEE